MEHKIYLADKSDLSFSELFESSSASESLSLNILNSDLTNWIEQEHQRKEKKAKKTGNN